MNSISPQISGDYYFELSDKWQLLADWGYAYTKSNNNYAYTSDDSEIIINDTEEKINGLSLSVTPVFNLSQKLKFEASFSTGYNIYSTIYKGSANTNTGMKRSESSGSVTVKWLAIPKKLFLTLSPGVSVSYSKVSGNNSNCYVRPTANAEMQLSISSKVMLYGRVYYVNLPTKPNQVSDVIVQLSPLLWQTGSVSLKNSAMWLSWLTATWIPSKWLTLSGSVGYDRTDADIYSTYTPAPIELGGIIKQDVNGSSINRYNASLSLSSSLLNNALNISLAPSVNYYYCAGQYGRDNTSFSGYGQIDYTYRNCKFSVSYSTPNEYVSNGGTLLTKTSDMLNFCFEYGNGDINLQVYVFDICHKRGKNTEYYNSEYYTAVNSVLSKGRRLRIILTYTFGYGKKVDHSINISGGQKQKSSVVGM